MTEAIVIDASALLAALQDEPGADRVQAQLSEGCMSVLNWSEVCHKLLERDPEADIDAVRDDLLGLGLRLLPVTVEVAELAARLREPTRSIGLSLADRVCLALAQNLGLTALTADRAWTTKGLGIAVEAIR